VAMRKSPVTLTFESDGGVSIGWFLVSSSCSAKLGSTSLCPGMGLIMEMAHTSFTHSLGLRASNETYFGIVPEIHINGRRLQNAPSSV
jgi:hypothetical protein